MNAIRAGRLRAFARECVQFCFGLMGFYDSFTEKVTPGCGFPIRVKIRRFGKNIAIFW